jgi:uncharacterized SAM-binding protein YcdF (DUF218 family)
MIRTLIVGFVVFFAVVIGISWYLQPDDLKDCGKTPGSGQNCQMVDAIVAISGGDTVSRADQAISMYKNGWADKLIFSGAAQDKTGPSNAAAMKTLAVNAGIPESNIILDEVSDTTQQNAVNSQSIFSENNIKSIILVTSGYHQCRANLEFSKRDTGVTVLNHPVLVDQDWSFWWWTTWRGWWLATTELVKIGVFYITGLWS